MWHGVKGFRNSPYGERRIGAITAIKARAPVLGGNFGVWGGLFSTFDCAVKGIRKKEDPYNAIIAGFFTGGALAVRGGVKAARNSAIGCAILLAVIEGVGIGIQRMMAENTRLDVSSSPLHTCHNCGTNRCLFDVLKDADLVDLDATPPSCSSTSGTITVTDGSLEPLSDGGVMVPGQLLYY